MEAPADPKSEQQATETPEAPPRSASENRQQSEAKQTSPVPKLVLKTPEKRSHSAGSSHPAISPRAAAKAARDELMQQHTERGAFVISNSKRLEQLRRESLQAVLHMERLSKSEYRHHDSVEEDIRVVQQDEANLFSPVPKDYKPRPKERYPAQDYSSTTPRISTKNENAAPPRHYQQSDREREVQKPLPIAKTIDQIKKSNAKKFSNQSRYACLFTDNFDDRTKYEDPKMHDAIALRNERWKQKQAELALFVRQDPKKEPQQWVYKPKFNQKVPRDWLPTCATPR
jgi:hypothetical protein